MRAPFYAVVGKVGRRDVEQIGMIDRARHSGPGEASRANRSDGERGQQRAMMRDWHGLGPHCPATVASLSKPGSRCFQNFASPVVPWPRVSADAGTR